MGSPSWLAGVNASQHCGLVVTLAGVGDIEDGQVYASRSLAKEPMVTWSPAGGPEDRFCVAFLWGDTEDSPLRLVRLVTDIPGQLEGESEIGPRCFGLAGNHEAVGRGTAALAYDPPGEAGALMVLLLRQRQAAPSLGGGAGVPRAGFSAGDFARERGLGELLASKAACFEPAPAATTPSEQKPLAHCRGGDLHVDPAMPTTLTSGLRRTALAFPQRGLDIYDKSGQKSRLTFSDLHQRSTCLSSGLGERLPDGCSTTLLQVPLMEHHFVAFWGCLLRGVRPVAIAIPTNYADGAQAVCRKIRNAWRLLDEPPVISTSSHVEKVALLRESADMDSMTILTVEDLLEAGAALGAQAAEAIADAITPGDVAFYQLSSGSTGVPKCIQIAHAGVVAHIHGESQFCGIGPDDVHASFLPLDHVVPILTVHCCDVYHGCEEVQAEAAWFIADPLRWLQLVSEHRATRTWAPNFAFKLVADALRGGAQPDAAFDLSCCRWWMNAGEQVTIPVCEDFLERTARFGVPRGAMQPAFGMAEACTCMTYNCEFEALTATRLGRSCFVSLGPPVPGVEIRIADASGCTLREEVIGRFQIRGAVVTPGYVRNDEANLESFVGDGWFNTGDVGFIRGGRLFLTGREKEMIIIRGANFYCYELEDMVNALPSVLPTFTAAVAAHDPQTGTEGFAVFCVPRQAGATPLELAKLAAEVRSILVRHVGLTPSHVVPLAAETFPKTTSGKIQRSQLAKALRAGEFEALLSTLASASE